MSRSRISGNSPFLIVPWSNDFLDEIYTLTDTLTDGKPGNAVIVFPNNRPRRYLIDIYRKKTDYPLLLPHIINVRQLIQICMESWSRTVPRLVNSLEQVALLKDSILDVAQNQKSKSGRDNTHNTKLPVESLAEQLLQPDGMAHFFPWGLKLANVLENCADYMVTAKNLSDVEDSVAEYAAKLLANLGEIQIDFNKRLLNNNSTTRGLESKRCAELADTDPETPLKLQGKKIIIAGFARLTESQDHLFRYLWKHGATICLHTDPKLKDKKEHWSCRPHRDWIGKWKAGVEILATPEDRKQQIHFYTGYDLHSQLVEMQKNLEEKTVNAESRAIVLTHDELLMPVLHHAKQKSINISMGYPLSRTLLAQLLERIMLCRESMNGKEEIRWKPLLDLIRHPYIRMLKDNNGEEDEQETSLFPFLRVLEQKLASDDETTRFISVKTFVENFIDDELGAENANEELSEANALMLQRVIDVFIENWRDTDTLGKLAEHLRVLCSLLLEYGRHIWKRFPLDAECLVRVMQNIIPELSDNALVDEKLSPQAVFAIFRQCMESQRVPFDADPLTGLQIIGMLETRLLRFDKVFLPDSTDDYLPGAPVRDPLLPDNLRNMLGLPDTAHNDLLSAHTFYRLIAGAKEVFLYWQEGVTDPIQGKKQRSRFVEEIIWELEQKEHRCLKNGEAPLPTASFPSVITSVSKECGIVRTDDINSRVRKFLEYKISPSSLNTYMSCPAMFFYQYICNIYKQKQGPDDDDLISVGNMVHNVLKKAFEPFEGKIYHKGDITEEMLMEYWNKETADKNIFRRLSPQSTFMLQTMAPIRLKNFLNNQPDTAKILQLEKGSTALYTLGDRTCKLYGKTDRVDLRGSTIHILDYKTGKSIDKPSKKFWADRDLLDSLENWTPEDGDNLLFSLAGKVKNIQLPMYLYIWANNTENAKLFGSSHTFEASWVQLAKDGEEINLFDADMEKEQRADIIGNTIPLLLEFLLRHLSQSPIFGRNKGRSCDICQYKNFCR